MIRSVTTVRFLAPVEHSVHFRRVRFVVHYATIDFDPGVSLKRQLLRTDDHLSWYAVPLQKACSGCGSLQTACLFPIPDAGHVYCGADLLDGIRRWNLVGDRTVANFVVECGEVSSRKMKIEVNQIQICLHHKKQHDKILLSRRQLQLVSQKQSTLLVESPPCDANADGFAILQDAINQINTKRVADSAIWSPTWPSSELKEKMP